MSQNWEGLLSRVGALDKELDKQQQNIYIIAGVLGGVDLLLIILAIVMILLIVKLKNQLQEAEVKKKVQEEIDAHKRTAYTGEEMHRKLLAASTPAVPLGQGGGSESEYAFNMPLSAANRRLGAPTTPNGMSPNAPPRFSKY